MKVNKDFYKAAPPRRPYLM